MNSNQESKIPCLVNQEKVQNKTQKTGKIRLSGVGFSVIIEWKIDIYTWLTGKGGRVQQEQKKSEPQTESRNLHHEDLALKIMQNMQFMQASTLFIWLFTEYIPTPLHVYLNGDFFLVVFYLNGAASILGPCG